MAKAPKMSEDEASDTLLLNRNEVVDHTTLKSAYRKLAHEHHPDKGGDPAVFAKLKDAYDVLAPLAGKEKVKAGDEATLQGDLLRDLGRGYPITESAKPCEPCEGKGFTSFKRINYDFHHEPCETCRINTGVSTGWIQNEKNPCFKCKSTGRFVVNGVDRGVCNGCKGNGFHWRSIRPRPCYACFGSGYRTVDTKKDTNKIDHSTCTTCKGVGEVKLFNPVLPRGYLSASR